MNFFRRYGRNNGKQLRKDTAACNKKRHRHRFGEKAEVRIESEDVRLSDCPAGALCIISINPHKKTKEIGLNPGKTISVFKNEPSDKNMIICLDMTRYIIAKSIADRIMVKAYNPEENAESGSPQSQ